MLPNITVYRTGGAGEGLPICKTIVGWRGRTGAICDRSPVTTGMAPGWYQVEAWIPGVDARGNYLPDAFGRRGKKTWVVRTPPDQSLRYDLGPQVGRGVMISPRGSGMYTRGKRGMNVVLPQRALRGLGSLGGMSLLGIATAGVIGYFVWKELQRAGRRGHL